LLLFWLFRHFSQAKSLFFNFAFINSVICFLQNSIKDLFFSYKIYSTVTDLARLRGLSGSKFLEIAVLYAKTCNGSAFFSIRIYSKPSRDRIGFFSNANAANPTDDFATALMRKRTFPR